jgi:hypothetical protein
MVHEPIHGVDLATYAWVTGQVADHGYHPRLAASYAAERGIDAPDWEAAAAGWAERLDAEPSLAATFRGYLEAR